MPFILSFLLLLLCALGCTEKPKKQTDPVTKKPPPTTPAGVDSMLAYALNLEDTLYVIGYPRLKDVKMSCSGQKVNRVRNLPIPQEREVNIFKSISNELIYGEDEDEIKLLYLCTYICTGNNKNSLYFVYYGKVGQRALLSTSFDGYFNGNIPEEATIEVEEMNTDRGVSRKLNNINDAMKGF